MSYSDTDTDVDSDIDELYVESDSKWRDTISKIVKSVVSVHFMNPVDFDLDITKCDEATAFVVDAERGILLTNRQVVFSGPFVGYAVFDNHEEVDVTALYRDPVHDFGFLKFEPSDVKHMQVQSIPLCPEKARIGEEIRVVGNDAGEKLSILSGIISRMDRDPPDNGPFSYTDFNTEYIQAAACGSEGSSGSPVINIAGEAVALQTESFDESATDFFVPLWRVKRALECIQNNIEVTRGTIQVKWSLEPFSTCKRLGLTAECEDKMRALSNVNKGINGMLVCELALPEGPADQQIMEGDCLISINGKLITSFVEVDEIFDSNVGKDVDIVVQRSGVDIKKTLTVGDLHKITPDKFVRVCGSTFNDYSYQMAMASGTAVKGVYVANGVGSFQLGPMAYMTRSWVITALDNKPTPNIVAFANIMKNIPDKAYVTVRYYALNIREVILFKDIYIDRQSDKSIEMAIRNDKTGLWDYTTLQHEPIGVVEQKPRKARFLGSKTDFEVLEGLNKSFVYVEAKYRVYLDDIYKSTKRFHGIVIDSERGLVLVTRQCIGNDICDVTINIAESVVIPGTIVFMHPTKSYAIVKYDPGLIDAGITTPKFDSSPLEINDQVLFFGYDDEKRLQCDIARIVNTTISKCNMSTYSPSYRAVNLDELIIDSYQAQMCLSGVLCCPKTGNVRAFWNLCQGEHQKAPRKAVDVYDIMWELKAFLNKESKMPNARVIGAEFESIPLAEARNSGVPDDVIQELEESVSDKLQFLSVRNAHIGLDNKFSTDLRTNDVILKADGKLINKYRNIEESIKTLSLGDTLAISVVRNKELMNLAIKYLESDRDDEMFVTKKMVIWAGCYLQSPHQAVRQLINHIPSKIYSTWHDQGSPCEFYSLTGNNFITHVNDIEVQTLVDFLIEVNKIPDNGYVKIRAVTVDQNKVAKSLKVNYRYCPTKVLTRISNGKWKIDTRPL